ncbi:hypothetical protein C0Q70_19189 [Pomacea canaliculata]|uniref:Uncharacterized protein n=1 Tax=Pomacea canaliculata TaxID=400727 RepID=A0A2T7NIL6_POMCA|nr:hypothetical protein C0Q70_19189 [Pomacea canaliculata]
MSSGPCKDLGTLANNTAKRRNDINTQYQHAQSVTKYLSRRRSMSELVCSDDSVNTLLRTTSGAVCVSCQPAFLAAKTSVCSCSEEQTVCAKTDSGYVCLVSTVHPHSVPPD